MRARRAPQRSFFDVGYPHHEMGRALERISTLLDGSSGVPGVDRGRCRPQASVEERPGGVALRGDPSVWDPEATVAGGLPGLEFALLDSASAKYFARVDPLRPPKKSTRARSWERRSSRSTTIAGRRDDGR